MPIDKDPRRRWAVYSAAGARPRLALLFGRLVLAWAGLRVLFAVYRLPTESPRSRGPSWTLDPVAPRPCRARPSSPLDSGRAWVWGPLREAPIRMVIAGGHWRGPSALGGRAGVSPRYRREAGGDPARGRGLSAVGGPRSPTRLDVRDGGYAIWLGILTVLVGVREAQASDPSRAGPLRFTAARF